MEADRLYIYRILDANFNRAREGIRVIEEIARFGLDDGNLAGRLKHLRHELSVLQQNIPGGPEELLEARDSAGDVGLHYQEEREYQRTSCLDMLIANFKRVEEAVRVLEEYVKFLNYSPLEFKKIRFAAYDLEKEMAARLKPEERRRD